MLSFTTFIVKNVKKLVSAEAMTCLVEKKENMFFLENQVPEE